MTLIAHYKCDNQDDTDNTLHDVSGHANNHDAAMSIASPYGFDHRRIDATGNVYSSADLANGADFAIADECTVMCWLEMQAIPTEPVVFLIGYGDSGETQAENFLWSLIVSNLAHFGMRWEHTAGVDVSAWSPADALDLDGDDFHGQTKNVHIAVIRTLDATKRDVKFVRNGIDMGADVTGLTAPDGGTYPDAGPWIGSSPRTTNVGRIPACFSDVRVYDSAESVATVLGIYNAEKATRENVTRESYPISILDGYELGGESGSIYVPVHTGSKLDPADYPLAGWESEQP